MILIVICLLSPLYFTSKINRFFISKNKVPWVSTYIDIIYYFTISFISANSFINNYPFNKICISISKTRTVSKRKESSTLFI